MKNIWRMLGGFGLAVATSTVCANGQELTSGALAGRLEEVKSHLSSAHVIYTQETTYFQPYAAVYGDGKIPANSKSINELGFGGGRQRLRSTRGNEENSYFENGEGSQLVWGGRLPNGGQSLNLTYEKKPLHMSNIMDFGFTIQGKWISDLLKEGGFKSFSRRNDQAFGPIIEASGKLASGADCVVKLAEKLGLLAVGYELKFGTGDVYAYDVNNVVVKNGVAFPQTATMRTFREANGHRDALMELRETVVSFEPGTVSQAFLDLPKLPPGARVKDERVGKYFEVGPNGELILRGNVGSAEPNSPAPTAYGWLLVGGVALTTLAAVIYAKRAVDRKRAPSKPGQAE